MNNPKRWFRIFLLIAVIFMLLALLGRKSVPPPPQKPVYHIYAGNTHSHTTNTWSHGEQWINSKSDPGEAAIDRSPDGVQYPGKGKVLRDNWQKLQGPPSEHFALAKQDGFDFYIVTDHSQEAAFQPVSPTNAAWMATKQAAVEATDSNFVALAGYEH